MSGKTGGSSGGIGFLGLLTLLFIGLKLTHHIGWSWAAVLSPLWITAAVIFTLVAVALVVTVVGEMLQERALRKRRAAARSKP